MSSLSRMTNHQASIERIQERRRRALPPRLPGAPQEARGTLSGAERRRWTAIGAALVTMTAVVGGLTELVLGTGWLGPALAACVTAATLAAWYTVSGRTMGMNGDVRERVLERHYIGVAWYASMLRTTLERGGYERGLRRELTRLAAARMAERHGVNLYRDPRSAEQLIGPDLWPLVDPAALRAAGADQHGRPGGRAPEIPIRAVTELIERLERM